MLNYAVVILSDSAFITASKVMSTGMKDYSPIVQPAVFPDESLSEGIGMK
jgi:hypothetical protein